MLVLVLKLGQRPPKGFNIAMGREKESKRLEMGEIAADHQLSDRSCAVVNLGSSAQNIIGRCSSFPDRERDKRSDAESRENAFEIASRRLEELRRIREEPLISKEQINSNEQRQEDEMLALEAIFGQCFTNFDRNGGLRFFQILIQFEVPVDDYTVSAKLYKPSNPAIAGKEDGGLDYKPEGFLYTFKARHLPPVILTCLFPSSYPSHSPPYFTVYAQWLESSKISNICGMMDAIWNDQVGQEVVYQWIECVKNSSFSCLGFENEVTLRSSCDPFDDADARAISGSVSMEQIIALMIGYNEEKNRDAFLCNLHQCTICFEEQAGINFVKFPCQHFYCLKCMETYLRIHVNEGTVTKLLCPDTKCSDIVPPSLLRGLLDTEAYVRWESLLLQKTLDSMADVVYCPRCETACLEDEENHAQCSKCLFSFCSLCRERRHLGLKCLTPEMKLLILEERQNSSNVNDNQRKKEREMINEILNVREALRDAKQCPSCKMAISRIEGCNKMSCLNCNSYFCYKCCKAIDGYDHFSDESCPLFPAEEVQAWEQRINQRQVLGQIRAELNLDAINMCPNCSQMNAKMGNNNHIFCWACQKHYCALCRQPVRRPSEHYGPKGCKQHTAGP